VGGGQGGELARQPDAWPGDAGLDGQLSELTATLERCTTVAEAAEAVMAACVDVGLELPSLYLEGGNRLRCVAQRGYWQVFDGLPPGAGVLGTTYASGRLHVVRNARAHANFIHTIPDVVAEVCVPLVYDGRTVGVLSVESRTRMDDDDVARAEALAGVFAARLTALGGPEPDQPAERLARLVHELVCQDDTSRLAELALEGALSLTGMRGAAVFRGTADRLAVSLSRGELGGLLEALPAEVTKQLADCVSLATSSYAEGAEAEGFEAVHALTNDGVVSLVVLALHSRGRRGGLLVLVDREPRPGIASLVPLLEMLAASLGSLLDAARVSAALQRSQRQLAHQAQHDPLTGVANRSHLLEVVRSELDVASPAVGHGVSGPVLLFVDLDGFKVVNDRHGHRAGDELLVAVADRLRTAARDTDLVARIGGDEFVVLCSRVASVDDGVAVARRVLARIAAPFTLHGVRTQLTACIGIAAGQTGSAPDDLIAAADRAMYAAKRTGSGTWAIAPN
jgi:diguanylate cyclase (GGDEF)-like protein